jgi:DNA-binding transcriptional LysR family regulator
VLHIGAITSAMLQTLPPLLAALKKSHPQLTIFIREIDSVEAIPALEAKQEERILSSHTQAQMKTCWLLP